MGLELIQSITSLQLIIIEDMLVLRKETRAHNYKYINTYRYVIISTNTVKYTKIYTSIYLYGETPPEAKVFNFCLIPFPIFTPLKQGINPSTQNNCGFPLDL